jgi:hypothetical protein
MNAFNVWVHQHSVLLAGGALVGLLTLLLVSHRRTLRHWLIWSVAVGTYAAVVFLLRTPAASISEHHEPTVAANSRPTGLPPVASRVKDEVELASVEAIREMLGTGGKPTLVELYVDYGFS